MRAAFESLKRILRCAPIYGPRRALYKVAGRLRIGLPVRLRLPRAGSPDIGLVGRGQFAFSTIAYYLAGRATSRIGACFDVDTHARDSLAHALRVPHVCTSVEDLLNTPGLRLVYISSNHASHAPYGAKALLHRLRTRLMEINKPQVL